MTLATKAATGLFGTLAALAALSALAIMSGCFISQMSSREALQDAVREYTDSVQWGNVEDAAGHVDPTTRDRFVERAASLENELEFSGYEVQRINLDAKTPSVGIVRVQYEWMMKRRGLLEHTATEQRWEKKGMKWVRVAEYRVKGSPLILFDERTPAKVAAPATGVSPITEKVAPKPLPEKVESATDKSSTPAP